MFAFKKNKELLKKLDEFLNVANSTFEIFCEGLEYLIENSIDDHFELLVKKISKEESHADDIRRQIEQRMYQQSILPETRGNLLTIIEQLDKIPNRSETILNMFSIQRTELSDLIKNDMVELLSIIKETFPKTIEATKDCFGKIERISELNKIVDDNESLGDTLERKMLKNIFASDMDTGDKILQREMILLIGGICDLCESAMDTIVITSIKRKL